MRGKERCDCLIDDRLASWYNAIMRYLCIFHLSSVLDNESAAAAPVVTPSSSTPRAPSSAPANVALAVSSAVFPGSPVPVIRPQHTIPSNPSTVTIPPYLLALSQVYFAPSPMSMPRAMGAEKRKQGINPREEISAEVLKAAEALNNSSSEKEPEAASTDLFDSLLRRAVEHDPSSQFRNYLQKLLSTIERESILLTNSELISGPKYRNSPHLLRGEQLYLELYYGKAPVTMLFMLTFCNIFKYRGKRKTAKDQVNGLLGILSTTI